MLNVVGMLTGYPRLGPPSLCMCRIVRLKQKGIIIVFFLNLKMSVCGLFEFCLPDQSVSICSIPQTALFMLRRVLDLECLCGRERERDRLKGMLSC